jgi:orotidine-5'-phosphate decarboxylase
MGVIDKYNARVNVTESLLCVGLDADMGRIPARFHDAAHPQFAFNQWIIEQTHTVASAYKLNIAFYEARGAAGWDEVARTTAYLRERYPDIFLICDAKRADIGNTNRGYVTAIFDELGFDAITLHPYLGREALAPFLERVDKGSIILVATSNPGASEFQAVTDGEGQPLWARVLASVANDWNTHGSCMAVVGATTPAVLRQAREIAPTLPFLVPGVGAQGGDAATVLKMGADANGRGLIVNVARGVIFADDPGVAARAFAEDLKIDSRHL